MSPIILLLILKTTIAQAALSSAPETSSVASTDTSDSSMPVLTLDKALRTAEANQPNLLYARSQAEAARAKVYIDRSALLPSVDAQAAYQRSTANFQPKPGTNEIRSSNPDNSGKTFNYYNTSGTISQLIYDFGKTTQKWRASQANAESQAYNERTQRLNTALNVRVNFFNARAQKDLVKVAQETLKNQERHLAQIESFVAVGTRPQIDLAQARTDRANAQVQLIEAENNYATSKAQLNQAMGIERDTSYDIGDDSLAPVTGEEDQLAPLFDEALQTRPELAAYQNQARAQSHTIKSLKGSYLPSIGAKTWVNYAGTQTDNLAWNWYGQITLNWNLFQGGLTKAEINQARATLSGIEAQDKLERQQILLELEQARLGVRAAQASLVAANEALINASERLRLAEGRYAAGAGSVIELGDAQVTMTTTAAQKVRAEYDLAIARAQLIKALGRQ